MKRNVNYYQIALAWLCVIGAMLLYVTGAKAQTQSLDDWKNTPVTLRVSNEPLGTVLKESG